MLLVQLRAWAARDDARLDYFLSRLPPWVAHDRGAPPSQLGRRPRLRPAGAPWGRLLRHERGGAPAASCAQRRRSSTSGCTAPIPTHLYAGSYSEADLRWWADRVREWEASGKDVYLYFNNDGDGNAVRNAAALRTLLGR